MKRSGPPGQGGLQIGLEQPAMPAIPILERHVNPTMIAWIGHEVIASEDKANISSLRTAKRCRTALMSLLWLLLFLARLGVIGGYYGEVCDRCEIR